MQTRRSTPFSASVRLTTAGLMLFACGSVLALGEKAAQVDEAAASSDERIERRTPTKDRTVRRERRGVVFDNPDNRTPPVALKDPNMSVHEAIRLATMRARMLQKQRMLAKRLDADPDAQGADDPGPTDVFRPDGYDAEFAPGSGPGSGNWDPPSDDPGMGAGYRRCWTHEQVFGEGGGRSFVTTEGLARWPELPLSFDAPDLDGDGEPEDPLPQRPTVVYYQFLEESMTEIDWDDGEDNLNMIGLRTQDDRGGGMDDDGDGIGDEPDGVIDALDTPEDTDGISDTWETPGVVRSILPPPNPDDFDPDTAFWLSAMGLGTIKWGDARPVFRGGGVHQDLEAAWRLAQREYRVEQSVAGFGFQDTFQSGQVFEEEERVAFLDALRAIESVTNIVFIERSDGTSGFATGYPFAPKGYTTDPNGQLVDPGAFYGGAPGDVPNNPVDDYPWILVAKGDPLFGTDVGNFATQVGAARFVSEIDYGFGENSGVALLFDLNNDGFPDTPDLNADGLPDQFILSDPSLVSDADGPTGIPAFDLNNPGALTMDNFYIIDVNDSSVTRAGTAPSDPGLIGLSFDHDGDGTLDSLLDPDFDQVPAVINIFSLQLDLDADFVGDSVFPGGTTASPAPVPFENIPCELLNMSVDAAESLDVGTMVHEILHHLGFLHEHQRPDREAFVHVNLEHVVVPFANQFQIMAGGQDIYANWINNFDTTPPDPTFTPPVAAASEWIISGSATSGGWAIADPVADPGGVAPQDDFDPDPTDVDSPFAVMCAVTGNSVGTDLDGETILTSPTLYGPADATVTFAYWLASSEPGPLSQEDGIIVQSSPDGGSTWQSLMVLQDNAQEWRQVSIDIGDARADDETLTPNFILRFVARDAGPDNDVEAAIDYVRVQNPYDFLSIMHYSPFAFSINPGVPGFETIEVLEPNTDEFENEIGVQGGLSLGDRTALMNIYGDPPLDDGQVGDSDPCRADMNDDGTIDGADLMLFLELYNAGDLAADFAPPEGVIDVFDLLQFFVDFQNRAECISGGHPIDDNNLDPVDPN